MLSGDYRRAFEHPYPTPVEDAYAGLLRLREHVGELGVEAAGIAVMGAER
jgi:acetyl esterase/lipase